MRTFAAPTSAYLASRAGVVSEQLLWVRARNRTTGAEETYGVWTGEQDATFTINGVARSYYGGSAMAKMEVIVAQVGMAVRLQRVRLNPLHPTVAQMVRGADPSLAPCEVHRALFSPTTGALVDEPHRLWKGIVNKTPIPTPAIGGEASCELELASSAYRLTRSLAVVKSHETQKLRSGDLFRQYQDIAGDIPVWWGMEKI